MLHDLSKNHHKAILGIKFINHLLINKLRLPNRSKVIFAIQNKYEKHKPWAIINVNEPQYPQYIGVIKPPITIPIWAAEE